MAKELQNTPTARIPGRWRIVALCSAAQSCGIGIVYGSFGSLLASTESALGISRAEATTAAGIIAATIGLAAPLLGHVVAKVPVRLTMMLGALLCALAYAGLALTSSYFFYLALHTILGIGIALIVVLGPIALISAWFPDERGKAFGIVNLPIALLIVPFAVAELLPMVGRSRVLLIISGTFMLLCALLSLIREPAKVYAEGGDGSAPQAVHADGSEAVGTRRILRRPAFWLLSSAIGIMAGAGSTFNIHIVPYGVEQGLALTTASALVSAFALAGLAGNLLFGWIADRFGPPLALAITAAAQMLIWLGVLIADGSTLFVAAVLMGLCVSPLTTLHGTAMSSLFGAANASRVMGYSYFVKLPFNATLAPAVAAIYVTLGGYRLPFLITSILLGAACLLVIGSMLIQWRTPLAAADAEPAAV